MTSSLEVLQSISDLATQKPKAGAKSLRERVQEMSTEKIESRIRRATGQAIADFNMIENGDRILVAISGGKDSWVLLKMLKELKRRAPVDFELIAVNIDQGFNDFRQDIIEDYVDENEYEYSMEEFDVAGILGEKMAKGETPCSLCSRLRRGSLYGLAEKHGCNKIALGHHLDDFVETLLLNGFYAGKLASMAPKLKADDGKNVVIRPLVYVSEAEIREYAIREEVPIVCCACPLMCGNASHTDSQRKMIKQMIEVLELKIPNIRKSLLNSLSNVRPSHLLDKSLWSFD